MKYHQLWMQYRKQRGHWSYSTVRKYNKPYGVYELSGITHVTSFRKYEKHSTGPNTFGPRIRTYSKFFSCKSVLVVCSYRAQSNENCSYGRVSRGSHPKVRTACCIYGQSNVTSGWNDCDSVRSTPTLRWSYGYNRNTLWLRDTVRQTSRGPLTSIGMPAWPYRVTKKYSFYSIQTNISWNNNSDALKWQIIHSSGPWNNAASIAAHSNSLSRTMTLPFKNVDSIVPYKKIKEIRIPYKENKGIRIPGNQVIRINADHVGCGIVQYQELQSENL